MRYLLKPFSFLPAIFIMYMIYSFSADNGAVSSALSYKVSHKMIEVVNESGNLGMSHSQVNHYAQRINPRVRKLAHMTEYAALAIAIAFPLYVYGLRGIWLTIVVGGICFGYAYLDEYHQVYVTGRVSSKKDVIIDATGALFGIIFVRILGFTGRVTLFRPKKKGRKKYHKSGIRADSFF